MPSAAEPVPIPVKERTATTTLPVGADEEVWDATSVTLPFAFAVAGAVKVGVPVYPVEVPPAAESNRTRVLSNVTATWYPPSTAGVLPPDGPIPVTPVRLTRRVTWTVPPSAIEEGLGETVTLAVPEIGAPCPSANGARKNDARKTATAATVARRRREDPFPALLISGGRPRCPRGDSEG